MIFCRFGGEKAGARVGSISTCFLVLFVSLMWLQGMWMGGEPIFCLRRVMDLQALIETTLDGLGYELVDVEFGQHGRMLRVFVDKPEGVDINDCARVSEHLTRLLAVELDYDYERLEVSSPGLDRVLKKPVDFGRFQGETVRVKLRMPLQQQRNFVGINRGVMENKLQLEVEGELLSLDLADVEKARLIPKV